MQFRKPQRRSLFFSLLLAYITILSLAYFLFLFFFHEKNKIYIHANCTSNSSLTHHKKTIRNQISIDRNSKNGKKRLIIGASEKNFLNDATANYLFNLHFKNTIKNNQKIKSETKEQHKSKQLKSPPISLKKKITKKKDTPLNKKTISTSKTQKKEALFNSLPSTKESTAIKKNASITKPPKKETCAVEKKDIIQKKNITPVIKDTEPIIQENKILQQYYANNNEENKNNTEETQETEKIEDNPTISDNINIEDIINRTQNNGEPELEEDPLIETIRHYFNRIQKHIALFPHKKKNTKITYSKNKNNDITVSFDREVPVAYKMHIIKTLKDIPLPAELMNTNIITSL